MPSNRKTIVGIFVLAGVTLFGVGLFWIGDRRLLFERSLELHTEFANLSALKVGSKVTVGGMDAGEILAIQVPSGPRAKFRVRFRVLEKFGPVLRTDSVASIQVEGLVGNKLLQVEPGSEGAPRVPPYGTIPGREPLEIADIMRETVAAVKNLNGVMDDVKERVGVAMERVNELGDKGSGVIGTVGEEVEKITASSRVLVEDVRGLVDGVKQGRGTVGKLVTDEAMYNSVRDSVRRLEATARNVQETSADVKTVVSDLKSRNLGGTIERTAQNVEALTVQAKDTLAALRPAGTGERGLLADLNETLANTREATSDLAENMEALKRNWLFSGFFKRRGFYDMDALSVEDYKQGRFAPDRLRERVWLHQNEVFTRAADGSEVISQPGQEKLNSAMAASLHLIPNTPVVVEGYAAEGAPAQQFLNSRDRALKVRRYLMDRFGLKPNWVGIAPMGAVKSSAPGGEYWDGVSVVFFPEKGKAKPAQTR